MSYNVSMATVARAPKTKARKTQAKKGLTFRVTVVVEPDGEEFYAYCPAIKGLHMGGATVAEAVKNAHDAAIGFLEMMIEYGDPIPVGVQLDANGKSQREGRFRTSEAVHIETVVIRF